MTAVRAPSPERLEDYLSEDNPVGAPALTDMISGQVQVMFDNIPTCAEHVKSGKLRGLAVTSTTRSEVLPDLPTVADFLPGYEASAWYGIVAPKNTSPEVIDTLNQATNAVHADPAAKTRFAELGALLLPDSAADFGKLLADETEKMGQGGEVFGGEGGLGGYDAPSARILCSVHKRSKKRSINKTEFSPTSSFDPKR